MKVSTLTDPPDAYAALRHAFVRSFAIGRFAAIAGWQMISVAVGWQLYERTGDPWALGLVGAVELAPVLFLMVVAGNAADRYPRRNVAIFAHALLTVAATGLALVSWLDGPTAAIYSLLVLIGAARAFASPSVNTILPQLLAPAEFANANAWLSSTFQLAAIIGPAAGGLLIAASGAATLAFAVAAAGQLVFIVFIGFSNEFGAFESGATAALVGPTLSVVGGGFATLLVVAVVHAAWPQLARIGPLHTLAGYTQE
ncbi:MAG: hypothetical protein A3J29_02685 [Acidobacteria bacterium RIFCSPLOWO2_12_FULL_67_14b]|nr:MAG: hypothetical protein A3J29_02685 [Acidobacteria bacterium RIFCSPLOWO2_12_FULL_67_14b]